MNEKEFRNQASFVPRLAGGLSREEISGFENVILGGMGGSGMVARILFFLDPKFPAWLHDDYGLPAKNDGNTLYVAISYSGNTAETLSFAKLALEKRLSLAVITSGGALLEIARENNLPHIIIPSGFQPRNAVLYMLRALLHILGKEDLLVELEGGFPAFTETYNTGRVLGKDFDKKIILIYASRDNHVLSHIWKIMLNETGKIPAFDNYFPELTHNEIQGILPKMAGSQARDLKILLLLDREDDERIYRQMKVFQDLSSSQGVDVYAVEFPSNKVNKLFYTLAIAEGAAEAIAELDGVTANEVPFINLFKKSLE